MTVTEDKLTAKCDMEEAICSYMAACGVEDVTNIDFSFIDQEIEDAISGLGGAPAEEEY